MQKRFDHAFDCVGAIDQLSPYMMKRESQGYELVAVTYSEKNDWYCLFFKRPVESQKPLPITQTNKNQRKSGFGTS